MGSSKEGELCNHHLKIFSLSMTFFSSITLCLGVFGIHALGCSLSLLYLWFCAAINTEKFLTIIALNISSTPFSPLGIPVPCVCSFRCRTMVLACSFLVLLTWFCSFSLHFQFGNFLLKLSASSLRLSLAASSFLMSLWKTLFLSVTMILISRISF